MSEYCELSIEEIEFNPPLDIMKLICGYPWSIPIDIIRLEERTYAGKVSLVICSLGKGGDYLVLKVASYGSVFVYDEHDEK
jgi:hypothetical protein